MSEVKPVLARNTLTTISELEIGDRFYIKSDKSKTAWTKVAAEKKVTDYQTYTHWGLKDLNRYPMAIKKETKVVFLRRPSATVVTAL